MRFIESMEIGPALDLIQSESRLPCTRFSAHRGGSMALPSEPVTLTVAELEDLNGKLSDMRHDINNHLSLIVAALELIRHKPHMTEKLVKTLSEQPTRITESVRKFSGEFERAMHITRPSR